jgi:predicted nucleic-acid-binding protein
MIALDTNVLVRFVVEDDPRQSARAAALIEGAIARRERLFVAHVVLCELVWVLGRAYGRSKPDIVALLGGILGSAQIVVEGSDLAHHALARYASGGADFADYLIAERASVAGCAAVATFDKVLLGEEGFVAP